MRYYFKDTRAGTRKPTEIGDLPMSGRLVFPSSSFFTQHWAFDIKKKRETRSLSADRQARAEMNAAPK